MRFNKRKWWHFSKNRSITVEIAGWRSNPSIYVRVDGDERDVTFHLGFGFSIYLTFENFLPKSWYPTYESKTYGPLGDEREISISWHGGRLWWNFWVSEEWSTWTKNKTWRKGCWHVRDWIMGKHSCERIEDSRQQFYLPFFEGIYNVEVIKFNRTDRYQRWFTKKND